MFTEHLVFAEHGVVTEHLVVAMYLVCSGNFGMKTSSMC